MGNLRSIFFCAFANFRKWIVDRKLHILAIAVTIFLFCHVRPAATFASLIDANVSPWIFPHITLHPLMCESLGCFVAVLYCDAPFIDQHSQFVLIRSGRFSWICGQIMYIVLSSGVFTLFMVLISMLSMIPYLEFTTSWGIVLKTMAVNGSVVSELLDGDYPAVMSSIISNYTPIQAMIYSMGLTWLVSAFFGTLILSFNLVIGHMSGLIAAGFFMVISYFSMIFSNGGKIYYISPLSWSNLGYLDINYTGTYPSPGYAVISLSIGIVFMTLISIYFFCHRDIDYKGGTY